uniref:Venom peptide n=1 Tax=Mesocestoides corti TaxID=53468 RepID=A0A5K3FQE3_MESCO
MSTYLYFLFVLSVLLVTTSSATRLAQNPFEDEDVGDDEQEVMKRGILKMRIGKRNFDQLPLEDVDSRGGDYYPKVPLYPASDYFVGYRKRGGIRRMRMG